MKSRMILAALLLCSFAAMAQTGATGEAWHVYLLQLLKDNWFYLLTIVYEIVIRVVPTGKTYSIITFVYRMLSNIIPDNSKKGGVFSILLLFACIGTMELTAQNLRPSQLYTVQEVQEAISQGAQIALHSTLYKDKLPNGTVKNKASKTLTLDTLAVANSLMGGGNGGGDPVYSLVKNGGMFSLFKDSEAISDIIFPSSRKNGTFLLLANNAVTGVGNGLLNSNEEKTSVFIDANLTGCKIVLGSSSSSFIVPVVALSPFLIANTQASSSFLLLKNGTSITITSGQVYESAPPGNYNIISLGNVCKIIEI